MNLRQAEVFRAVMQTGSMTGAAKLLHVSQPAISRVLKHTEDVLGYLLFERRGTRLLPTPEAEALREETEAALEGMQRVAVLAAALGRSSGTLRIAANPSFGAVALPDAVARFRARHPRARMDMLTTAHPFVVDRIALRQADIGLTQFPVSHPAVLAQRLGSFPCAVALPAGSPLAQRRVVPVAALQSVPLISYERGTPIGDVVGEHLAAHGVRQQPEITVRYPLIACMFVDAGLGAAVIDPFMALEPKRWRFAMRPLDPPLSMEAWLLTPAAQPLPHAGRGFIKALRETLAKLLPQD